MRTAWMFFITNLTYFAAALVTALLILATSRITAADLRKIWKRELVEYGPEIVKNEIGKRERKIAAQEEELFRLREEKTEWVRCRTEVTKILDMAIEILRR